MGWPGHWPLQVSGRLSWVETPGGQGLSHPVGSGGAAGVESVPTGLQVQQVEAELPRVPVDHLYA